MAFATNANKEPMFLNTGIIGNHSSPLTSGTPFYIIILPPNGPCNDPSVNCSTYVRTIGDVILPDGRMLNQELVKAALAWVV